ncbi:MAG: nitrilase-related carbon-nitrogen hydrolase, partial [Pirellulaceae bacterium]
MKLIRVAAAAINQTPLDWESNFQNMLAAINQARADKASILCLPELCITGYGCEDAFHSPGVQEIAQEMLRRLLPATADMIVSVGLPLMYAGGLFNTACLIVDRRVVGVVAKQHLAGDGIHYEPRWFKPWPQGVHGKIELGGQSLPIGDIFFNVGGIKIGFEICEDAWVGTRPGGSLAARGVDVILNPSASHFAFDKHAVRRRFVLEGSRAFNVTYIYTNLVGNESGRAIFDGDVMIVSAGSMVARGRRLSFKPVTVTSATVDIDSTRMMR